jgi:RHS repeat-associated protein
MVEVAAGPDAPAEAGPLVRHQLLDHLGSVTLELDESGRVLTYEEFRPYGETACHIATGAPHRPPKRYRFTGGEWDACTGLYDRGARDYDPSLARWTGPDPAGMVDGPNRFAYVRNNPVRFIDPTGLWGQDMHLLAVYGAGRIAGAGHSTAYRAALASESLDDEDQTAAPAMKIRASDMDLTGTLTDFFGRILNDPPRHARTVPNPYGGPLLNLTAGMLMRLANNSHALGVSFDQSESVARAGINAHDDLEFGLGLHPVGDYLAHANLSGWPTFGHQNGANEVDFTSTMFDSTADTTHWNPMKALDTIARFIKLWADFLSRPASVPAPQVQPLKDFVLTEDWGAKLDAFRKAGLDPGETDEAIDLLGKSKPDRHQLWVSGLPPKFSGTTPWFSQRDVASRLAAGIWLGWENDNLLRVWRQDVSRALNLWATLGQTYPPLPSPPEIPPVYNVGF